MTPHRRREVWTAIAIAAAALVLGVAATGLMAASGAFHRTAPASWRAQSSRCGAPAAKGSAVDVAVWDTGRMMRGPNWSAPNNGRPGWYGVGMMGWAGSSSVRAGRAPRDWRAECSGSR